MTRPTALLGVLLLAAAARAEETVKIDAGEISGVLSAKKDVRVYKGIPFAAPPVGPLRWKPPQPVARWEGVRACTKFGSVCPQPQTPIFQMTEPQSEDCLYLNVWTPAKEKDAKLPVMVWIHGGSFAIGSGSQEIYDGEALARHGVVLVTINYRLGPFGFLAHPALSRESGRDASGNYGFLDQVAALEWVKRNVAAFGGDPGCVTIFGESAGGGSVMAHMLSPLAKGLFHRAIVESGVVFARPLRDARYGEPAEKSGERFAEALGCKGEDALAAMRAKSADELLAAGAFSMNLFGEGGIPFGLVVDGHAIPEDPLAMIAAGKQRDVPLVIGTTADEGSIFTFAAPLATRDAYEKWIASSFGANAGKILDAYPVKKDSDVKAQLTKLVGDSIFIAPARAFVRARPGFASKAWLYSFRRVSPGAKAFGIGAHHAAELRYVFDTVDAPGALGGFAKEDRALAKVVCAAWARFARTGDPNGEGLPEWPAYDRESDRHLVIGDKLEVGAGLERDACDLLEKVYVGLRTPPARREAKKWY